MQQPSGSQRPGMDPLKSHLQTTHTGLFVHHSLLQSTSFALNICLPNPGCALHLGRVKVLSPDNIVQGLIPSFAHATCCSIAWPDLLFVWVPPHGSELHVVALLCKLGLAVHCHLVHQQYPGRCQLALQQGGKAAPLHSPQTPSGHGLPQVERKGNKGKKGKERKEERTRLATSTSQMICRF